ncbi:MAG: hypothetical protein KC502_19340 [Myxococcales bacterium]|nr:hypothetical protein [Myxococcales bacterium]
MNAHPHKTPTTLQLTAPAARRPWVMRALGLATTLLVAQGAMAQSLPQPGPNPVAPARGFVAEDGTMVVLSDASITGATTVAVQPLVLGGGGAWFDMATRLMQAKAKPAAIVGAGETLATLGHQTLGFAGQASAGDRAILRTALHIGALQSARALGDACATRRLHAAAFRQQALLSGVNPVVAKLARAAIAKQRSGDVVGTAIALGNLVTAATAGTASKQARAHGYLAAGVWAGGALMVASLGGDSSYAMMAEPLALELDKDAAFGAADRQVAAALRGIAKELRNKEPSATRIRSFISTIVGVSMG